MEAFTQFFVGYFNADMTYQVSLIAGLCLRRPWRRGGGGRGSFHSRLPCTHSPIRIGVHAEARGPHVFRIHSRIFPSVSRLPVFTRMGSVWIVTRPCGTTLRSVFLCSFVTRSLPGNHVSRRGLPVIDRRGHAPCRTIFWCPSATTFRPSRASGIVARACVRVLVRTRAKLRVPGH